MIIVIFGTVETRQRFFTCWQLNVEAPLLGKTVNAPSCKRTVASTLLNSDWQVVQRSVCQRDGRWFLKLLQAETDRMEGWCRQMELDQRENALPEDSRF